MQLVLGGLVALAVSFVGAACSGADNAADTCDADAGLASRLESFHRDAVDDRQRTVADLADLAVSGGVARAVDAVLPTLTNLAGDASAFDDPVNQAAFLASADDLDTIEAHLQELCKDD